MPAVKKKSQAKHELDEIEARAAERYEYARGIKELQDEPTQLAINRMIAVMTRLAPVQTDERRKKIQFHTHTWIAVRLLIACAEWDIKIVNFKAPKGSCVKCGKKLKN